jgi:hypothetical protein
MAAAQPWLQAQNSHDEHLGDEQNSANVAG